MRPRSPQPPWPTKAALLEAVRESKFSEAHKRTEPLLHDAAPLMDSVTHALYREYNDPHLPAATGCIRRARQEIFQGLPDVKAIHASNFGSNPSEVIGPVPSNVDVVRRGLEQEVGCCVIQFAGCPAASSLW